MLKISQLRILNKNCYQKILHTSAALTVISDLQALAHVPLYDAGKGATDLLLAEGKEVIGISEPKLDEGTIELSF